ncbi:protein of unknown function [Amycolatopsis arida]|uniref:Butirosin biosynthesis protein H N-terminal domain-containing protein n=1 Tax=Amycolatopsis arida TaxID=587909 RepID=A0A1I6A627_9PSEU|nr:BtrH N-terminal domain-containing protein [Amycolatopsis arida]TDX88590.1 uncharacterized protein DUF4872 [Amycolatopsis arida]SFQ64100.1 protein of unknown function [Amycolatopsis arida]
MSGYRPRGGRQPDTAAVANLLAHAGAEAATEPLVLLAAGGIAAGYRLDEFTPDGSRRVILGFRASWRRPHRWLTTSAERLALRTHRAVTARGAARRLSGELAGGRPALVLADRCRLGHWHLADAADGDVTHCLVVTTAGGDRVCLDDRNLTPLTVERPVLDAARRGPGRTTTVLAAAVSADRLAGAVRAGLAECVAGLAADESWARWADLLLDERAGKGWPTVFADRRGLVGALLEVWTAVGPAGVGGGHLRDRFADGLAEAAPLLALPALEEQVPRWRDVAARWAALAEAALPTDVPEFDWMRGLALRVRDGVRAGDAGRADAAEAAIQLRRLRDHHDAESPFTDRQARALLLDLGQRLRDLAAVERSAVAELAAVVAD